MSGARRVVRTVIQVVVGVGAGAPAIVAGLGAFHVYLTSAQIVAVAGGAVVALSAVQNAIEDHTGKVLLAPSPPAPTVSSAPAPILGDPLPANIAATGTEFPTAIAVDPSVPVVPGVGVGAHDAAVPEGTTTVPHPR